MSFNKIFWQKIISAVAIFSVFMSINAPIVYAQGFFSKSDKNHDLPEISREKLVAVLVEEGLLDVKSIKDKIERYAIDVQQELSARSILIPVPQNASPIEIKEGLAQFYFSGYKNDHNSQLVGAVFIGNVPIPVVEKNSSLNPAIFPYTDFENTSYKWDYQKERFVWEGGDDEPEIWHGLIRSDLDEFVDRVSELERYFENNNRVHQNNVSYPKKVFFVDFLQQSIGTSDKQKKFYENWINHIDDFMYLRFNKHWLDKLSSEEISEIPEELLPASMQGQDQSIDTSGMPDVFAKNAIESMSMKYISANSNLVSKISDQIESAGRWTSSDIDTTISLIAKKDEWAANIIKNATDEVENILIQKSRENNVAANISIPLVNSVTYIPPGIGSLPASKNFPDKWLGIEKTNLRNYNWRTGDTTSPLAYPAENCTLYRGTVRNLNKPIAQKVEISRVFKPPLDEDPDDRCKAETDDNGTSGDDSDDFLDHSECRFPNYFADMASGSYSAWNGVDDPVFNYAGSIETFNPNYDGASACAPIILELQPAGLHAAVFASDQESFSSMMVHNEPTLETINAQIKEGTARDIPIDINRGFSFYDYAYNFHRVHFPNAFDLVNKRDELDSDFELLTKNELENSLTEIINQINQTNGNSAKIQSSFFDNSYWLEPNKQRELIDAIKWLGTDLEQKNIQVFTGALSSINVGRNSLKQIDYDGYELIEIRGELSDISPEGGLKVSFERGDEKPTTSFLESKNKELSSSYSRNSVEGSLKSRENSKLQKEFEDIFAENKTKTDCENANLLVWPIKCLTPWLAELPIIFTKVTKLVPNIDLEKEESLQNDSEGISLSPAYTEEIIELNKISTEPSSLKISNTETSFQDIEVLVKDENGSVLKNDYETEIEIYSDSSDFEKFFSVFPAKKVTVKAGKAVFNLLPKKQQFGGQVDFKFRGKNIISNNVSTTISTKKIELSIDRNELIVADKIGAKIKAKIINNNGELDKSFDGEKLFFTSNIGEFYSDDFSSSRSRIKNGIAEINFIPGTKSGEAKVSVSNESATLPFADIEIEIIPGIPDQIVFTEMPEKLIKNGSGLKYFAEISDKYGNKIPDLEKDIKWINNEKLSLESLDNGKLIKYKEKDKSLIKNISKAILNKKEDPLEIKLEAVFLDKEGQEIKFTKSREIFLEESPFFEIEVTDEKLIAGSEKPISIKVLAKKNNGEVLKNNFTAQLLSENSYLKFPKEIYFKDGLAEFEIFAGNKSETANIKVLANGFIKGAFSLDVDASSPYKINLISEKNDVNADSEEDFYFNLEVVDKYGNITDYEEEIILEINPREYLSGNAETLKDLGIFSNPATAESFIENQQEEIDNEIITEIISLESNSLVTVSGKGKLKFKTKGIGGKVYAIAKSDGLVSGTNELDVTKVLAISDLKFLSPKSMLTLMLGFAGGDINKKNLGNRFLFDGQTQAVATHFSPIKKDKILTNIFSDYKISEDSDLQIFAGNYFTVLINDFAKAEIKNKEEVGFFVGRKSKDKYGIYFEPYEDYSINNFSLKSREIYYEDNPLFSVTKNGGIIPSNSKLYFESINNSLFSWKVLLEKKELGEINIKINESNNELNEIVSLLNDNVYAQEVFNGKTTNDKKGIAIFSKTEKESSNKLLGSSKFSHTDENLGWTSEWKAASIFAGNNSIGDSAKWGSSDNFVLLGDPSLSLKSNNEKSDLNLTKDLGKPLWKNSFGSISDISIGDINQDDRADIFVRTEDKMHALYQDANNLDNFRDLGEVLRFSDGAKQTVSYNSDKGDLIYIIQLNDEGELVFHHNLNGVFSREKINLGINSPIEKIKVARLNNDSFFDLVILDNSNNLYFSYGREEGFYSAQKLDSLAASFEKISEKYLYTDGQDLTQKFTNPAKFRNLNNFFAGFSGSNNHSWTGDLNKINGLDFMPVTDNDLFDIRFEMAIDNPENLDDEDLKVENGTKFNQYVTVYSKDENLDNFQLIVPFFAGFEIDYDSFEATNCGGDYEIEKKENSFLISGCNIKSATLTKFSWELKAQEIPIVDFLVEDFEGNDSVNDISIPWEIDGKKKFIQYLSQGSLKFYPPNPAKKTIDSPESPITKTHRKLILNAFPEGTKFPIADFDAEASAEDLLACLKDSNGGGTPELYKSSSVDDILKGMSKANFAGLQIPSMAFLAPGSQSIYVPPISFPNPAPSTGTSAVWVAPNPPYVGAGSAPPTSLFRLYLMPTTTLRFGIGLCLGPIIDPSMSSNGSPFPPQCFVIIPPLFSFGGGGNNSNSNSGGSSDGCKFENPANSSGVNISKNDFLLNAFATAGPKVNLGSFLPKIGSYSQNKQINPPDIITTWIRAQMKEFSNFKFPRFDIIMPSFESEESSSDDPLEKISASPFIEVKRKKMEINYPKFSKNSLIKLEEDFGNWKEDVIETKDSLKEQLLNIDFFDFVEFESSLENYKNEISEKLSEEITYESLVAKKDEDALKASILNEDELSVQQQSVIRNEINKLNQQKDELKTLINEKIDSLKDMPENFAESFKQKVQDQIDQIERVELAMEKNIQAMKSYEQEIKKITELPQKIKKATKEIAKINDVIKEYWGTWIEKNKKAAQEWKNFEVKVTSIMDTWNTIPELFKDFTTSCAPGGGGGTTSVNRGTMLTWMMKILLSAIKLPVIPMPQFPDTKVDLSEVNIGVEMTIPEISFRPVDVTLPGLPNLIDINLNIYSIMNQTLDGVLQEIPAKIGFIPSVTLQGLGSNISAITSQLQSLTSTFDNIALNLSSFDQNFAGFSDSFPVINIPEIPVLPEIPAIVPEVEIPTIDLPQLPTLLPPPEFPNMLQPITSIVSAFKPFFKTILCGLSMGIIPIPEWKVASRVVQQTNRTKLLFMDFVFSAQLPNIPKIAVPPIEIKPSIPLIPAFDALNNGLEGLIDTMNNVTNMLSSFGKGGSPETSNIINNGSSYLEKKINKTVVSVDIYDQVEKPAKIDNSIVIEKIKNIAKTSEGDNFTWTESLEKTNLDKKLSNYKGIYANNGYVLPENIPNELPTGFDTSEYRIENIEPQPDQGIHYFSSSLDKSEKISDFPINGVYKISSHDLDEDGNKELIYSINGELFLKRLVKRDLTEKEKDNIYEVPNNLNYINFAEFTDYFSPADSFNSETNTTDSKIEFLAPQNDESISYFEWIISERPDRIFENNIYSNNKSSEKWQRVAFLLRPRGRKYEIRKGAAKINKVKGNPILYGNSLTEIEKLDQKYCKDDSIVKPFLPKETILVGIDKESKFEVRTKKRDGQIDEVRSIILRKGEEAIVDFAEICLTKGAISFIDLDKTNKFTPKSGDHFFSNMRLELGKNDEVELSLFNGTDITVYGGEKYELHSFYSREKLMSNIQNFELGNNYGQLISFDGKGKSYTRSKTLLHDPQLDDDKNPPEIIINQGSEIIYFLSEDINIDASESYDDQKISRVWWKQDEKIFLDSNKSEKSATESLNINLSPRNIPEEFEVELNIEDESGNISTKNIPVKIKAPDTKLSEASKRDQEIIGKLEEGRSGIKIGFLRKREAREVILDKTVLSEENGRFNLLGLSEKGNIFFKNKETEKPYLEILKTGRPVLINEKEATYLVKSNPLSIDILSNSSKIVARITPESKSKNSLILDSISTEIPAKKMINMDSVYIIDSNLSDDLIWKRSLNGASMIDIKNNKTVGIIENNGKFAITDYLKDLKVKIKSAKDENDPMIFQIYNSLDDSAMAEFFIPIGEIVVQ